MFIYTWQPLQREGVDLLWIWTICDQIFITDQLTALKNILSRAIVTGKSERDMQPRVRKNKNHRAAHNVLMKTIGSRINQNRQPPILPMKSVLTHSTFTIEICRFCYQHLFTWPQIETECTILDQISTKLKLSRSLV